MARPPTKLLFKRVSRCIEPANLKAANTGGYPIYRGRLLSHIVAEAKIGIRPDGMSVLHSCDNRRCIRSSHLYYGDMKANARDRELSGRRNVKGERNPRAQLNMETVRNIKELLYLGMTPTEISESLKVKRTKIYDIKYGRCWRDA